LGATARWAGVAGRVRVVELILGKRVLIKHNCHNDRYETLELNANCHDGRTDFMDSGSHSVDGAKEGLPEIGCKVVSNASKESRGTHQEYRTSRRNTK